MSAPVLVAYDPIVRDRAPVRFAASVAAFTGAPLIVASVYADDDAVGRLAGGQMGEDLAGDADEALAEVLDELRARGTAADSIAIGATTPPRGLELAAVQTGAALVVAGSGRRGEPGRVAPGATGERVLDGTPSAVALVPREWDDDGTPPSVIAVGVVDTAEGHAAVRGAQALARRAGARMRVLSAVQPRAWMRDLDRGDPPPGAVAAELRARAEDAAAEATPDDPGVPADVDVDTRDAAELLVSASQEADLLVCGARSYGPAPATLLGGVARRVVTEARCPVIVLARGAEVELEQLLAGDGR